jgi:hypothetical protein
LFTNISVGIPSPLQGSRAGTRLWACTPLDRGDNQHRTVEHAENPLDLGDEIRVPGSVDQVDRHVPEGTKDTTADLMVIPRRRSNANESVWVLPASTLPTASMTPAA